MARQVWHILQEPSSLSARILKAVYFPDVDFLSAGLGSSPSRIWRAIVDGKGVLEDGMIRRIGTDEETFIWCMNWLPRDGMMRPFSYISNGFRSVDFNPIDVWLQSQKSNRPFASNGLTLHAFHLAGHAACPAHGSPPRRAATGEGKAERFGAGMWYWSNLAHGAELVHFGSRSQL